jgi:hypothetical protein
MGGWVKLHDTGASLAPRPLQHDGPAWIHEAVAITRDEIRAFVTTALGFMSQPGRFCGDWVEGRRSALNPLGFVATALGVSGLVKALVPDPAADGFWNHVSQAALPYVYFAVLGLLCHPLLRLGGSHRRLHASVAVSLFAGGGPGLLSALSISLAVALRLTLFPPFEGSVLRGLPSWALGPFALLTYAPSLFLLATLALGLAGLHACSRLRAVAAVMVSVVVVGFTLGVLQRFVHLELPVPHVEILVVRGRILPDIWF